MHKLLKLTVFFVIIGAATVTLMVNCSTRIERHVNAQKVTNASNLTGVEYDSSSGSVTARLNVTLPEPESEDYPTPSPTDQ
jgi:hypothetical protein